MINASLKRPNLLRLGRFSILLFLLPLEVNVHIKSFFLGTFV